LCGSRFFGRWGENAGLSESEGGGVASFRDTCEFTS